MEKLTQARVESPGLLTEGAVVILFGILSAIDVLILGHLSIKTIAAIAIGTAIFSLDFFLFEFYEGNNFDLNRIMQTRISYKNVVLNYT